MSNTITLVLPAALAATLRLRQADLYAVSLASPQEALVAAGHDVGVANPEDLCACCGRYEATIPGYDLCKDCDEDRVLAEDAADAFSWADDRDPEAYGGEPSFPGCIDCGHHPWGGDLMDGRCAHCWSLTQGWPEDDGFRDGDPEDHVIVVQVPTGAYPHEAPLSDDFPF